MLILIMIIAVLDEVLFVPLHESFLGDIAPHHLRSSYFALNKVVSKGSALIGSIGIYIGSVSLI